MGQASEASPRESNRSGDLLPVGAIPIRVPDLVNGEARERHPGIESGAIASEAIGLATEGLALANGADTNSEISRRMVDHCPGTRSAEVLPIVLVSAGSLDLLPAISIICRCDCSHWLPVTPV